MSKNYRFVSFILILSILFSMFSIEPSANILENHLFTYEELACMDYEPSMNDSNEKNESLMPMINTVNSTRSSTVYYIIECDDGYMLTNPSNTSITRTRYSNGGTTHNTQKWTFTEDTNGDYTVFSYSNTTKCLTVNPTTKTVSLSTYSTSSNYQKWMMYYSSNGNALKCVSSDSRVNGYKLVISGSGLSVSNSTYTPVGFFDISWYTPVENLSYSDFYIAVNQFKYINLTKSPSNATTSNNWIKWSASNPSKLTVEPTGKVTGVEVGVTKLFYRDKITRVYGWCYANVVESGTIGILNVFSDSTAIPGSGSGLGGHSFLSFINISNSNIIIGGLTVQSGKEITFGTWGNLSQHNGIWYNYESYCYYTFSLYTDTVSLSECVSSSDITTINSIIANNDTWSLFNNCSSFAKTVWNGVSSITLNAGNPNTPNGLKNSIMSQQGYETSRVLPETTNVGYVNNGVFISVDFSNSNSMEGLMLSEYVYSN